MGRLKLDRTRIRRTTVRVSLCVPLSRIIRPFPMERMQTVGGTAGGMRNLMQMGLPLSPRRRRRIRPFLSGSRVLGYGFASLWWALSFAAFVGAHCCRKRERNRWSEMALRIRAGSGTVAMLGCERVGFFCVICRALVYGWILFILSVLWLFVLFCLCLVPLIVRI